MRPLTVAFYRLLLFAYPADFRRDFGPAMVAAFSDLIRRRGALRLLIRETFDVLLNGSKERWRKTSQRSPSPKGPKMELAWKDLSFATRALVRSPGFAAVAVISLALGIGANTAVFSMVNAVLLNPMPVEAPNELVAIYASRPTSRAPFNLSYPNFADLAQETAVFSELVGFQGVPLSMNVGGEPELVWSEMVTGNYFSGLGVKPAVGRTFLPQEADVRAAQPVTVLSHAFWQRRFNGDESVIGEPIELNTRPFTVVGVAAPGFTGAKFLGFTPDLWVPLGLHEQVSPGTERLLERRSGGWLNVRGRLESGVTMSEAEAALSTVASRLEKEYPDVNRDLRLHLIPSPRKTEPFVEVMSEGALPVAAGVLLAVVAMVLLIACANVASLQVTRSLGREKELAVRLSLGATRSRIMRQLLLESLLLCVVGGALGLGLGQSLLDLALRMTPSLDFSVDYGVTLDARVLAFTIAISLAAGIVSGLFPALKAARRDVSPSLKEAAPGARASRWASRRWIVIPQIALSLVALVCAGLLVRSFQNASSTPPGFATDGVLLASVNLDLQGYDETRAEAFYRQLTARLRRLPNVSSAGLGWPLPLDAYSQGASVLADEADIGPDDEGMTVLYSVVGEDYFETVGTALVQGRGFRAQDTENAPLVAVVNETLAHRLWPDEGALGKRLRLGREGPSAEVVGVTENGKYLTLGEEPAPYLYLPLLQNYQAPMTIVVRTEAPPTSLEAGLRAELRALDPALPVYGVKTIGAFLERSLAPLRVLALTVSLFGVLSITLATVGLYGLMSFAVSQRRHELGIRMALGASKRDVFTLFLEQAAVIVGLGLAVGLAFAWASTRVMGSLLFGVSAGNPAVFGAVVLLLALVALAGTLVPSRRAALLDPIVTLRHE